jgi:hypothetical protein
MYQIKGLRNHILVKVSEKYNETYDVVKGKKVSRRTLDDEARSARTWGEVIGIPSRMDDTPLLHMQDAPDQPTVTEWYKYTKFKTYKDYPTPVEVGDKVYFHWNTLLNPSNEMPSWGELIYKVPYDQILCCLKYYELVDEKLIKINPFGPKPVPMDVEVSQEQYERPMGYWKEGKREFYRDLKMVGGWTLSHPDMENWDEISIPVAKMGADNKPLLDKNGKPVLLPKEKWLVTKSRPEAKMLLAYLDHIDEPLKGDPNLGLDPGVRFVYYRNADWEIKIEGQPFLCIQQKHILGVV